MNLEDKVCVVTGAAGQVGHTTVEALRESGAQVVAVHHGANSLLIEEGPRHQTIEVDLADPSGAGEVVSRVVEKFDRIDTWINTVGGFQLGSPVETATVQDWKDMLNLNFITTLNCCQAVLPVMKARGSGWIINFGSPSGEAGLASAAPYAVSKAAVHALTKTMALEGARSNVLVRALLPDTIDTPQNRRAMPDADRSKWLQPADIARFLVDLLADDELAQEPDRVLIPVQIVKSSQPEDILSVFNQEETGPGGIPSEDDSPEEIPSEEAAPPGDETPREEKAAEEKSPLPKGAPLPVVEETVPPEEETVTPTGAAGVPEEGDPIPGAAAAPEGTGPETKSQPVDAETAGEEPQPVDAETASEKSQPVAPEMASFSMVSHLTSRGLYREALEMLDALILKGEDPQRVKQEKAEIAEYLGTVPRGTIPREEESPPPADEPTEEATVSQEVPPTVPEGITPPEEGVKPEKPLPSGEAVLPTEEESGLAGEAALPEEEAAVESLPEEGAGVGPPAAPAPPEAPGEAPAPMDAETEPASLEPEGEPVLPPSEKPEAGGEQKPPGGKRRFRPTTAMLLVILVLVAATTIWIQFKPDLSLISSFGSHADQEEETPELAQVSLPDLEARTGDTMPVPAGMVQPAPVVPSDTLEEDTAAGDTSLRPAEPVTIAVFPAQDTLVGRETAAGDTSPTPAERTVPPDTAIAPAPAAAMGEEDTAGVAVLPAQETPLVSRDTLEIPDTLAVSDSLPAAAVDTLALIPAPGDPQELFRLERYQEAAQSWSREKHAALERYTVVLEYACFSRTVRNAFQALGQPADFYLLPRRIADRECFVFCWGDFPNRAGAEERLREVPAWFVENGARPAVRPLSRLLPDF